MTRYGNSLERELKPSGGRLTTAGGAITLLLPENVRASIDAKTSGGRAQSELSLSSTELSEHTRLRGAISGGGEPIVLRTSGGSIHVEALR